MLMPALNQARQEAKKISCANNLKQLVLSLSLYAEANAGYFPKVQWGYANVFYDVNLPGSIIEYIGDRKLLMCPSQRGLSNKYASYDASHAGLTYRVLGGHGDRLPTSADYWYGWANRSHRWPPSSYPTGDYGTVVPSLKILSREAEPPSEQPLAMDPCGSNGLWYAYGGNLFASNNSCYQKNNHRKGSNICFADNHLEWRFESNFKRMTALYPPEVIRW
jgi:prepilin-type processing-associated H-X9-DG protein